MQKEQFLSLVNRYINGTASEAEKLLVEMYYEKLRAERETAMTSEKEEQLQLRILEKINSGIDAAEIAIKPPARKVKIYRLRWAAVAAILIAVTGGILFYHHDPIKTQAKIDDAAQILSGGNKAMLILEDGSAIDLNKANKGVIASQAGLEIEKTADGQLVYSRSGDEQLDEQVKYNTVITPNGGQYEVTLSDGTKVWLNSASSLQYPSNFTGKARKVILKGEGYFEVSHDASKPFIVSSAKQEVEVLGTHFNINAYGDEQLVKTTLLEGSVKVAGTISGKTTDQLYLKPNQQSVLSQNDISVKVVDAASAIDWKNGYFIFKKEDIRSIMRKYARWYDIDVAYEGNIDQLKYSGKISRSKNLKEALQVLLLTGDLKIKVEERRITVMP